MVWAKCVGEHDVICVCELSLQVCVLIRETDARERKPESSPLVAMGLCAGHTGKSQEQEESDVGRMRLECGVGAWEWGLSQFGV